GMDEPRFAWIWPVLIGLAGLGLSALALLRARRRVPPAETPAQIASRLLLELESARTSEALGRRITQRLAAYLTSAQHRPPGRLPPDEARLGIQRASANDEVAVQAARLVSRCDAVCFGRIYSAVAAEGRDLDGLIAEARAFFRSLRDRPL